MKPTDARIAVGAELYHAAGDQWKVVPPKKAVVTDLGPYRIVRRRQGAFYLVAAVRDDAGNAVMVHLDGEPRPRAIPARELRGLWLETLAATGRTVAGVKAHDALLHEIASTPGEVTVADVLRLAACDEGMPDDVLTTMAEVVDSE